MRMHWLLTVVVVAGATTAGCTADRHATAARAAGAGTLTMAKASSAASAPTTEPPALLPETVAPLPTRPSGPSCAPGAHRERLSEEPDYSDFIQFAGRTYILAVERAHVVLGDAVGMTRCRLDGSGTPRSYTPRDGDAAFEPAGTRLFRIRGRQLAEALAVRSGGTITVYETER